MSLNKFMHPRNKYKVEPDYKLLAVQYPDFRKIAVMQLNGKVKINFKDKNSLTTLTQILLKHDFGLDVNLPPTKLVPALPLRLNYILWIEDILNFGQITKQSEIHGIDIGTGAIAIYPLLIAQQYKWKMTGTEIDPVSFEFAIQNIKNNQLDDLISVNLVSPDTILKEVVKEENNFTFVMCNPPFFHNNDESQLKKEPPRNAPTGTAGELIVDGGERKFISRLIDDSAELKNQVQIYTTMIGKKETLSFVKKELAKRNISNLTWSEFCQGYTKRWGLAWTFLPEETLNLKKAPVIRTKNEVSKKNKNSSCQISFCKSEHIDSVDELNEKFVELVKELNVGIEEINWDDEDYECYAYKLMAYKDSWTHARRKRRMSMKNETEKKKCKTSDNPEQSDNVLSQDTETEKIENKTIAEPLIAKVLFLKCFVLLQEIEISNKEEESTVAQELRIRLIFDEGSGGKQALETIKQYFINQLKVRELLIKSECKKGVKLH